MIYLTTPFQLHVDGWYDEIWMLKETGVSYFRVLFRRLPAERKKHVSEQPLHRVRVFCTNVMCKRFMKQSAHSTYIHLWLYSENVRPQSNYHC